MKTTFLSILVLAVFSHGVELKFSGTLDADVAASWNSVAEKLEHQSNQEIDLATSMLFAPGVSAQLFTTFLAGTIPSGGGSSADRWGSLAFDGLALSIERGNTKWTAGDMVILAGALQYYRYKRTIRYAAILPEQFVRGVGLDFKTLDATLTLQAGAADDSTGTLFRTYAAVDFQPDENMHFKPFVSFVPGAADLEGAAGIEYQKTGNLAINGSVGILASGGADPIMTILAEPGYTSGNFSLAVTYYQELRDDTGNPTLTSIDEKNFVYVEPGLLFSENLGGGLPIEYHGRHGYDEDFVFAPTLYVYPADDVEWWLWAGLQMPVNKDTHPCSDDACVNMGSELIMSF